MPFCRPLLPLFVSLALMGAQAAPAQTADVPPPPPLPREDTAPQPPPSPSAITADEELEPEVTIIEQGEARIEQYTLGGQLYMVKISPGKGVPYYLIDMDGDGSLETHRGGLDNPTIQQWILLRW